MGYSPPDFSPADNPAANDPNFLTRFLTFLYLPFCNFWLLIYPWNLSYDWSMNTIPLVKSITSTENILSALLYITLLAFAFCYLKYCRNCPTQDDSKENSLYHSPAMKKDGHRKHSPNSTKTQTNTTFKYSNVLHNTFPKTEEEETSFVQKSLNITILSLSAMILPFLPATNLFFYVGFVLAERILYIPSIGFCLLILNGLNVLMKLYKSKQKHLISFMAFILIMFALRTYGRNFVWKDEETLYRYVYLLCIILLLVDSLL